MSSPIRVLQGNIPAAENFDSVEPELQQVTERAREAARVLSVADSEVRTAALKHAADALEASASKILAANQLDMEEGRQQKLKASLLDRLDLTEERLARTVESLREIAAQPDPVGALSEKRLQPSGIEVAQMRVPLGVIGVIYESRPNVTADAAALCLRSGNACILHGGKEARRSNAAITAAMTAGLRAAGLPEAAVQPLLADSDPSPELRHWAVKWLLGAEDGVDLVIPRGGKGLTKVVAEYARVPVLKHLTGMCHVYVHADANLEMAEEICYHSKCYRSSICCSVETVLLDTAIAPELLPRLAKGFAERNVEVRGCEKSRKLVPGLDTATDDDWATEHLGPVLAVQVVNNLDAALEHLAKYSSGHTDSIVTENEEAAQRFQREVDSSSVMHNLATVFADGKEYGLGAEIGISTDRLHARGPMGANELTIAKFVVTGRGQKRKV